VCRHSTAGEKTKKEKKLTMMVGAGAITVAVAIASAGCSLFRKTMTIREKVCSLG
jgi:hypothetical protein